MTTRGVPPLRGDVVRLAGPWGWAGRLQIGAFGIIDGPVGALEGVPGARLMFGAGTGPGTIWTPFTELRATAETHTIRHWRTKRGDARAQQPRRRGVEAVLRGDRARVGLVPRQLIYPAGRG